jgi:hypothetical protein
MDVRKTYNDLKKCEAGGGLGWLGRIYCVAKRPLRAVGSNALGVYKGSLQHGGSGGGREADRQQLHRAPPR